jgi:hypothetical protein
MGAKFRYAGSWIGSREHSAGFIGSGRESCGVKDVLLCVDDLGGSLGPEPEPLQSLLPFCLRLPLCGGSGRRSSLSRGISGQIIRAQQACDGRVPVMG